MDKLLWPQKEMYPLKLYRNLSLRIIKKINKAKYKKKKSKIMNNFNLKWLIKRHKPRLYRNSKIKNSKIKNFKNKNFIKEIRLL